MGLIKGVEKIVKAEGFDFQTLKAVGKQLNEAGVLKKKINLIGSKEQVVSTFMQAFESVPEGSEEERKLPADVIKLYNSYVDVIEDKAVGVAYEGTAPSEGSAAVGGKAPKGKGKAAAKAGSAAKAEKDAYGFKVDSIMHQVALVVEAGGDAGVTVKDVKAAPWNVRKDAYKAYWMKMVEKGFATFKDGRITLKKGKVKK